MHRMHGWMEQKRIFESFPKSCFFAFTHAQILSLEQTNTSISSPPFLKTNTLCLSQNLFNVHSSPLLNTHFERDYQDE